MIYFVILSIVLVVLYRLRTYEIFLLTPRSLGQASIYSSCFMGWCHSYQGTWLSFLVVPCTIMPLELIMVWVSIVLSKRKFEITYRGNIVGKEFLPNQMLEWLFIRMKYITLEERSDLFDDLFLKTGTNLRWKSKES